MDKTITEQQKQDLAKEFLVDLPTVKAVYNVESSGEGFSKITGKIKIQFEPTILSKLLLKKGINHSIKTVYVGTLQEYELVCDGIVLTNGVEGQQSEYEALELAKKIDSQLALMSTSWGIGQIMGFNYVLAGYSSVDEMVNDFLKGESQQLRGMLMFIKNNKTMLDCLRSHNWAGFADLYNGPSYRKFNYDVRLKEAYNKLT